MSNNDNNNTLHHAGLACCSINITVLLWLCIWVAMVQPCWFALDQWRERKRLARDTVDACATPTQPSSQYQRCRLLDTKGQCSQLCFCDFLVLMGVDWVKGGGGGGGWLGGGGELPLLQLLPWHTAHLPASSYLPQVNKQDYNDRQHETNKQERKGQKDSKNNHYATAYIYTHLASFSPERPLLDSCGQLETADDLGLETSCPLGTSCLLGSLRPSGTSCLSGTSCRWTAAEIDLPRFSSPQCPSAVSPPPSWCHGEICRRGPRWVLCELGVPAPSLLVALWLGGWVCLSVETHPVGCKATRASQIWPQQSMGLPSSPTPTTTTGKNGWNSYC